MSLYPLQFEPIYKPKVWGGRALERFGRTLPGDDPIGESWEVADLDSTSASGGGGDAARSVVANGPLAGQTLGQLIERFGPEVVGDLPLTPEGRFPLLVKFLDANENLSVQVHPSPAYAAEHNDAHLKSEAWYIMHAEPGAVIYKGVVAGTTPEQFASAIADNTVEHLMITVPVEAGQCHYLPSGTCHALGAGILVAEVQTPSDTTFRVYDWGRTGRQLHIEQALACIEFGPAQTAAFEPGTTIANETSVSQTLVTCDFFNIRRVSMTAGYRQSLNPQQPVVWMIMEGGGRIDWPTAEHGLLLEPATTVLLPAALADAQLTADQSLALLEVTFPQAGQTLLA